MNILNLQKKKFYSKLNEKQILRKDSKFLYIFLTTTDDVEKYAKMMPSNSSDNCVQCYNNMILNLFDPELQLINTKPIIINKLKELLKDLKRFKVQTILILEYCFRSNYKLSIISFE